MFIVVFLFIVSWSSQLELLRQRVLFFRSELILHGLPSFKTFALVFNVKLL